MIKQSAKKQLEQIFQSKFILKQNGWNQIEWWIIRLSLKPLFTLHTNPMWFSNQICTTDCMHCHFARDEIRSVCSDRVCSQYLVHLHLLLEWWCKYQQETFSYNNWEMAMWKFGLCLCLSSCCCSDFTRHMREIMRLRRFTNSSIYCVQNQWHVHSFTL